MQNQIPKNWQQTTLGGTATLNYGKSLPESTRREGGVPVYGSSGVTGYHNQALVQEESYIIGRKGTIGSINYAPAGSYPIDTVYYVPKSQVKCDFKFFHYLLKTLPLNRLNYDSAVPGLNRDIAYSQEFAIPSLKDEQKRIASVLFAFDDKIETNNRIAKTLEEMAQAIFKEWFVKFKFPGHEKVKMVDSELGKIPEGWEVKSWGETEKFVIGGDWGKETPDKENNTPVFIIRGTDLPSLRNNGKGNCPLRYIKENSFNKRKLSPGDIVIEVSGGSENQPTGRCILITKSILDRFDHPLVHATFCRLSRSVGSLYSEIKYLQLDRMYNENRIWNYQIRSTGISNFQYEYFQNSEKLVVPTKDIQNRFLSIVHPMIKLTNKNENIKLSVMRGLLLTKLMRGEIRV